MLGEQIAELKGKIMGQRVLDVEGPKRSTGALRARGPGDGNVCRQTDIRHRTTSS
jgi:hypothetical protein